MRPGIHLVRSPQETLDANFNGSLVLVDNMSTKFPQRYHNGHFGVYVSQNASNRDGNILSRLWDSK